MTDRSLRRALAPVAALLLLAVVSVSAGVPVPAAAAGPAASSSRLAPTELATIDPGLPGTSGVVEGDYDLGAQAFRPTGFPGRVELTGRVYAPATLVGRAPVVVIQHGRHVTCADALGNADLAWPCPAGLPAVPSYQGYGALGRNLASHGLVVVSIGANGINAADDYVADSGAAARGELVLEHLRRLQAWDGGGAGAPLGRHLAGHLDLTDVGLVGHSRGGEGVVAAAQLNQRTGTPFGIRSVLALAPVDFARRVLGGVALGVVLPYCDGDVSDLQGAAYYDDSRHASPGDPAPKSTMLLYGANHNWFNTVWTSGPGSFDDADFGGMAQGTATLAGPQRGGDVETCAKPGPGRLTATQQESAGVALMGGFLRRHLRAEEGLQRFVTGTSPFPASVGPARWAVAYHAPDRLDVEAWTDASTFRVNRFDQRGTVSGASPGLVCDPDGGSSTDGQAAVSWCPTGSWIGLANVTAVLDVGWSRPTAWVRQELGRSGVDVSAFDGIRLRVAVPDDSRNELRPTQDLAIVLEDVAGRRAAVAAGPGTNALRRLPPGMVTHVVLNGVRLPLSAYAGLDLRRIRAVEVRLDRTSAGRVLVSDLAFTREGTGSAVGPVDGAPGSQWPVAGCRTGPATRWACAITQVALGRDPNSEELAYLALGYRSGGGRRATAGAVVATDEARRLHGARFVETYAQVGATDDQVDAPLSAAGRRHWEVATVELAEAFAFASRGLSTPGAVVVAGYQTLLGRSPEPAGLRYWTGRVTRDGPRPLAAALVRTASYRGRVVDERYRQVLGRGADARGRAFWIGRLAAPGGEQALLAALLGSEGFRVGVR